MTSASNPLVAVESFNQAFNAHDMETMRQLLTDDCIFEDTTPPDGRAYKGREAVLDAFRAFFAASPQARFSEEETHAGGDAVTVLWRYDWGSNDEEDQHVRGIDLFTVRCGRIAAKRSYVKG